ncbi:MAG: LysM peptidoglycan-binding domain-containing protein, partial [Caldilinea sp.]
AYASNALAPAASPLLPGDNGYHIVARGQTLSEIAKSYGMTTGDLMRLNSIANANMIWVGQRLRVTARVEAVAPATANAPKPAVADEIYVVQAGDTLAGIAAKHKTTVQALLTANGLPNPNFVWVGQRLRVRANTLPETTLSLVAAPANGKRWIEIDLTNQTLTAWQGDVAVMFTKISSGRAATPTVTGRFTIGVKYKAQRMTGPGYDLPNVPWVMYFHGAYAIHGAYWHNNFGVPMSHGCVNMRPNEAEMLYNWAAPGTEVYVRY